MAVTRTRPRALVHRLELRPQTKGVGVSLALLGFLSFRPSARSRFPSQSVRCVPAARAERKPRRPPPPPLSLSHSLTRARSRYSGNPPPALSLLSLSLSAPRYATQCCRCSPLCSASPPDCVRFLPWNKSMGRATFKCILSLSHTYIHTCVRAHTTLHGLCNVVY